MKKIITLLALVVLNFTLQAQQTVTIGSGIEATAFSPTAGYFEYSWSSIIYTANEIGTSGELTSIAFDVSNESVAGFSVTDQKIYVRETTASTYTDATYPSTNGFELVYEGTISYTSSGWKVLTLDTSFDYSGTGNLEFLFEDHSNTYEWGFPVFRSSTTVDEKVNYDFSIITFPSACNECVLSKTRPNIQLTFSNTDPQDLGGSGDSGGGNSVEIEPIFDSLEVTGNSIFKGSSQFDGLVKMGGLTEATNSPNNGILFIDQDGVIQRGTGGPLIDAIYQPIPAELACLEGWRPSWSSDEDGNLYTRNLGECEVNVGIGTDTPESRLHVIGDIRGTSLALGRPSESNARLSVIRNANNPETVSEPLLNLGYYSPSQEQEYNALTFNADGNLVIRNGGDKILQLENDGLLRAREIKVDLDEWPDYVFDENYELMPLAEVKLFIQQNGHLPNVPKASEVEENGVSLGETAKVTMEKVEELMLYILQQQELLEEQREQLEEQAKKIEELELKLVQPQR